MGKSDPLVFNFYKDVLDQNNQYESIGFFGFPGANTFTDWFISETKNYYDIALSNWNINEFPYEIGEKIRSNCLHACCILLEESRADVGQF